MNPKILNAGLRQLRKDERLAMLIKKYPKPEFSHGRSSYEALVRAIIHQQLSGKAAATILRRFLDLYPGRGYPKPEAVLQTSEGALRAAGVSAQKASYLKDLSKKFLDGTIVPKKVPHMSDEEISEHLIAVKGIGRWSADMFLMFTFNRPDVLPTGDLGIQKGMQRLFNMRTLPDPVKMEKVAKPWSPYRTIASWYLWRLADEGNLNRPS